MAFHIITVLLIIAVWFDIKRRLMNNEKTLLDTIRDTVPLVAAYIGKLQANQKDPADAQEAADRLAEEQQIADSLKALLPATTTDAP